VEILASRAVARANTRLELENLECVTYDKDLTSLSAGPRYPQLASGSRGNRRALPSESDFSTVIIRQVVWKSVAKPADESPSSSVHVAITLKVTIPLDGRSEALTAIGRRTPADVGADPWRGLEMHVPHRNTSNTSLSILLRTAGPNHVVTQWSQVMGCVPGRLGQAVRVTDESLVRKSLVGKRRTSAVCCASTLVRLSVSQNQLTCRHS
jgi:hypothetical protein